MLLSRVCGCLGHVVILGKIVNCKKVWKQLSKHFIEFKSVEYLWEPLTIGPWTSFGQKKAVFNLAIGKNSFSP